MAAREREQGVGAYIGESDGHDRQQPSAADPQRRPAGDRDSEQEGERSHSCADERREGGALAAAEPEEVGEEAERAGCDNGERDRLRAFAGGRAALFDRGQDGASERDDGARERDGGRALAGCERDRERHDGAAGDDRRDDAHRPERERPVEGGEARAAADAGGEAERERASVDRPGADRDRDEQRGESGRLGHDRDGDRRQAARDEAAAEVGGAPDDR